MSQTLSHFSANLLIVILALEQSYKAFGTEWPSHEALQIKTTTGNHSEYCSRLLLVFRPRDAVCELTRHNAIGGHSQAIHVLG